MAEGQKFVDPAVVKLEKNIVERYESVKGQVARLQGTLDTMETHWKGIGANAFNSKQVEINERMKKIGNLLVWFLDNIDLTRRDKDKLEDEVRATMQSIDVEHGGKHSALNSY